MQMNADTCTYLHIPANRYGQETLVTTKPVLARLTLGVTNCKANLKLCILLPSCSTHHTDIREVIIDLSFIIDELTYVYL